MLTLKDVFLDPLRLHGLLPRDRIDTVFSNLDQIVTLRYYVVEHACPRCECCFFRSHFRSCVVHHFFSTVSEP